MERQDRRFAALLVFGGIAFYFGLTHFNTVGRWAGVLLLAGGLGNLVDRLRLGYVVDMFNFQFMNYPVFNIADICVVCGMVLAAVYYLFLYEKYDSKQKEAPHGEPPES